MTSRMYQRFSYYTELVLCKSLMYTTSTYTSEIYSSPIEGAVLMGEVVLNTKSGEFGSCLSDISHVVYHPWFE